ncbi:alpha/beta family hydrolase [Stutzerimonas kirkiae]|uniref:alpha/beta family hydrolase n=1 Tax=Stutzerimonas kirkiae TaxID=2211392 RepID=UPI0010383B09|nr:alpha/beta family hydrolase [Stutzerimonas kirkiae]TBV07443.1 alpha/beta hydrolase [Stutzerimonas kirkiae]TBV11076.1 alpha/beta hydrolase [Stutzerimonas kirkiae]
MEKGQISGIDPDQYTSGAHLVAGIWSRPERPSGHTLILAHGAGAPMDSDFMNGIAGRLANLGVAVFRFEFPYMRERRETGRRRPPNPAPQLLQAWREAHAFVRQQTAGQLAIGGKSMGGRMASMLADELDCAALVCLGYPFHAAGRKDKPRVEHLAGLRTPALIVQGERDALGDRATVATYALSPAIATLWLESADHDLKPLRRSGFTHELHLDRAAREIAGFLCGLPA